ncbi:hypothetical protein E8E13_007128 [Curvularia kusanoi]|uniref:Uncharacterized protein n=1 Tax=Curvularia kusanoi TaxID=90978 RepID=A0A9P4WCY1_CURKU|nr:hypothetical protein E8E13_007128 [Curvularia kusanoi]
MATQNSLPGTPSRRVLGDLPPRAMNTPSKTKSLESSELTRAQSPLKQLQGKVHTPRTFAGKENVTSTDAFPHGRKRSIADVDDAESVPAAKMVAFEHDTPQQDAITQLTAAAVQRHTSNDPSVLADPGSPTERATPTPSPPSPTPQWNEPQSQPFPDSQKSFSEFLDYGLCASQQSEHGVAVPAPKSAPKSKPTPKTPTSASATKSRAQLLRTRLTFAKYKVRTNQVSKPSHEVLSDYELSSSPDALRTSAYTSSAELLAPAAVQRVPDITISSPSRHPVFVRANLDPFRPIGALGQPPVSFAPPTENSAVEHRVIEGYEVGSSPPVQSVSPAALMSPTRGEESKHERLQRLKEQQWRENSGATGNAGNAAKGLMELMSGRR